MDTLSTETVFTFGYRHADIPFNSLTCFHLAPVHLLTAFLQQRLSLFTSKHLFASCL